jgi:hypothetical protein
MYGNARPTCESPAALPVLLPSQMYLKPGARFHSESSRQLRSRGSGDHLHADENQGLPREHHHTESQHKDRDPCGGWRPATNHREEQRGRSETANDGVQGGESRHAAHVLILRFSHGKLKLALIAPSGGSPARRPRIRYQALGDRSRRTHGLFVRVWRLSGQGANYAVAPSRRDEPPDKSAGCHVESAGTARKSGLRVVLPAWRPPERGRTLYQ